MKRILMVAYHFPPLAGSSGIQRTLRFTKYLPEFGWEPLVLSAHPRAYERTSDDQLSEIAAGMIVVRAPAFDTARHCSVAGRYPGFLARPDRWISWLPGAFIAGISMIRRYKPDVIWSTYPIATAHLIGGALHKHSGLPWIADFRDPMTQENYPRDPVTWNSYKRIEERSIKNASLSTFTTPGTSQLYSHRYPQEASRFKVIENGYDEETFTGLTHDRAPLNPGITTLLHSGIVYQTERDPTQFMQAIRILIDSGKLLPNLLRVRFRASMNEDFLRELSNRFSLDKCIELLPPVPYKEALDEMMRADILLVMQASCCNDQIPAKLYEYFRAGRPILALTDPAGDTDRLLRAAGISTIAPLNHVDLICHELLNLLQNTQNKIFPEPIAVEEYSRKNRTRQFASLLNELQREGIDLK
jgi:glycosyltransferase involved in cell wall biosynthesis